MKHISIKFLVMLMAVMMVFAVCTISVFAEETEAIVTEEQTTTTTTTTPSTDSSDKTETTTSPVGKWFSEHLSFVIAVGIVVVLVAAYFIVRLFSKKFKEKTDNFWKEYNSQFKKLVWPSKEQFWKNAAVVFAAIIIFGAILALLDWGISKGIWAIKDLMNYILPAGK